MNPFLINDHYNKFVDNYFLFLFNSSLISWNNTIKNSCVSFCKFIPNSGYFNLNKYIKGPISIIFFSL